MRSLTARAEPIIYLDHPATTPCDPRVIDAMLPWLGARAANAAQLAHGRGRAAASAVDVARAHVAVTAGLVPGSSRVVLTSGATEANNLALFGVAGTLRPGARIVVSAVEHASVLAPARRLRESGFDVREVGVNEHGRLRLDELAQELAGGAGLVSVQLVNNETGVVQPVHRVGELARAAGAIFHVDAVQAFGKLRLDPVGAGIDLLSVSAHKVGGPTGIGALVARDPDTLGDMAPLLHGGGQEHGLRPGTTNVAAAVGFGEAARIARDGMSGSMHRCSRLQRALEQRLTSELDDVEANGADAPRSPCISSVTIGGVDARRLLASLPQIAASTTSACGSGGASHVLAAMGRTPVQAAGTMRLGIGAATTSSEVDRAVDLITAAARAARSGDRRGQLVPV